MIKKYSAFTLIELIVVITILAILGTIAFISLQGYQSMARDSIRVSDMQAIQRVLEYHRLQSGSFPNPQEFFTVSHSGSVAWRQGVFGNETLAITGRLSEV
ncbi:type II secretion system GspH family protein, partial [Candidatus Gracilibacteria bacterium]|nr:type II secretion system GspH family protein [Candidatus Gracilibacteria bacterium]